MAFRVEKIISSTTINVAPFWKWMDQSGVTVKIIGYNKPAPGELENFSMSKLASLILNQLVELKNPVRISENMIHCSVYLNDIDISFYFKELQC